MKQSLKSRISHISRSYKRLVLIAFDVLMIPFIIWCSYSLRFDQFYTFANDTWFQLPTAVIICIPIFIRLGLYHSILKYFRNQAVITICIATLISTVAWVGICNLSQLPKIPASVALMTWLGTFALITISRLVAQQWLYGDDMPKPSKGKPVLIYGAGVAGTQLANVLKTNSEYCLKGFIDDDLSLKGWNILGLDVHSPSELKSIIHQEKIAEVILALPSAGMSRRRDILKNMEQFSVSVRSVPAFSELANGKLSATDIKDIDINDLLGRNVIEPDKDLLPANIQKKVVLVTGAGGSIGSELCRQIINLNPTKLILLEQSEFALYQIEQELEELILKNELNVQLNKILGSINNEVLLKRLFANKSIHTIYHAAAYKHVPLVEANPVAGLENNIFGTKLLATLASQSEVETFILISTDKAVRPTNVMGCSKRIAEMVLQALAENQQCDTTFSMVRFGNVLGSSGSVVPKFRQQIKEGGPITVTHEEITRFFMSIPEAVQLVIQAGAMAKGGDVFVLDMGEPVKIVDLAKKMIKLSSLSIKDNKHLDGDIAIKYTGLRPGEKLYEELLIGDNVTGTRHKRIMRANEVFIEWEQLIKHLEGLQSTMLDENIDELKLHLSNFVDGYKPWIKKQENDQDESVISAVS